MLATKGIAIMNGTTEQGVCEDAEKCNQDVTAMPICDRCDSL